MSDDAEQKPPKLRLSRDARPPEPEAAKAAGDPESAEGGKEKTAAGEGAESPSKPDLKLNREKLAYDPDDPFGDILPEKPKRAKKAGDPGKAAPPKLGLNRSKLNPAPPEAPERAEDEDAPPPELPGKPAPRRDDGSAKALDESINRLPKPAEKKRGFPLASVLLIFAMLAVLAGAGYGIWFVFAGNDTPGEAPANAARTQNDSPPKESSQPDAGRGPIAKAKEVVADISTGDLDAIAGSGDDDPAPGSSVKTADVEPPAATVSDPSAGGDLDPANGGTAVPASTGPSTALREKVSGFLSEAEIGAVRAGEEARVMLNGTSYRIGDLVDAETGLIFVGTREQRLVFRDRNEVYYVKSF